MDGITELTKHIKARDNPSPYTPMFGTIISLPELKIKLGSRILLYADDIKATFNIYDKTYDSEGRFVRYTYLNKEVVLLPYGHDNKFIVIGAVQ